MNEPVQPLTLRLPPELHQAVKDAARAADLSMAQWIRRAIREKMTGDVVIWNGAPTTGVASTTFGPHGARVET